MDGSSRRVLVEVSPEALCDLLSGKVRIKTKLPGDAAGLRLGISNIGQVNLILESTEFDKVPWGSTIPRLDIEVTYVK